MYKEFFGFSELPFSITPDPKFVFYSQTYQGALAQLLYGIQERKGLMICTGEVGVGKTTMIYTLMSQMGRDVAASLVFDTHVDPPSLYRYIFSDFGLEGFPEGRAEAAIILKEFLTRRLDEGKKSLLILDEAHNLRSDILNEVVHLTNFETRSFKLLQIILVGQPELKAVLNSMEFRQLKQRISLRASIKALNADEVKLYVHHRLAAAGARDRQVFTDEALALVHAYSRGLPRMINSLCDNALLLGFSRGASTVDAEMVQHTYAELMDLSDEDEDETEAAPPPPPIPPKPPKPAQPVPQQTAPPVPPQPAPRAQPKPAVQETPKPAAPPEHAPPKPPAPEPAVPAPPPVAAPEPKSEPAAEPKPPVQPPVDKAPKREPIVLEDVRERPPGYVKPKDIQLTDESAMELMPSIMPDDPSSRRQYHLLGTRLAAISRASRVRTVVVTSSVPQEGKTITSINLAFTMAQESKNEVVLVDADLRQPAIHTYFGHPPIAGAAEVLQGKISIDDALHEVEYGNLNVMFAGRRPSNPMELIGSPAMKEMVDELASRFHFVIIDSPPVAPIADSFELAHIADGVILVVRSRFADRAIIKQTVADLDQATILGVVFNDQRVRFSKSKYGYGYGYGYTDRSD